MIAWLVAILARWGVAERFQRPAAVAVLVAAAIAAGWGSWETWLHFHDEHVVEKADAQRELGEANTAIASEHRATANAAPREEARAAAAEQSHTAMKDAEDAHPEAAQAAAGPVSRVAARRFSVPR